MVDEARDSILHDGLTCLTTVEPEATRELLTTGIAALGHNELALIASAQPLLRHTAFIGGTVTMDPPDDTLRNVEIVGAFQSLSTLLEIRLKQVTGSTALFYDVVQAGYRKNLAVWARFEAEKRNCGMLSKSATPYATRLRYALSPFSAPSSHKERFAQSLLVTYIVRNYSTHDMDVSGPLVEPTNTRTILGHFLNVFTYCDAEKSL